MRNDEVEQFFAYSHLPDHLASVSLPFFNTAMGIISLLPPSAERTLSLRKLWESKNYAVWCAASNPAQKFDNDVG